MSTWELIVSDCIVLYFIVRRFDPQDFSCKAFVWGLPRPHLVLVLLWTLCVILNPPKDISVIVGSDMHACTFFCELILFYFVMSTYLFLFFVL